METLPKVLQNFYTVPMVHLSKLDGYYRRHILDEDDEIGRHPGIFHGGDCWLHSQKYHIVYAI